jgi:hypothetical protein
MLFAGDAVLVCAMAELGSSTTASRAGINRDLKGVDIFISRCLGCCWFLWLDIKM